MLLRRKHRSTLILVIVAIVAFLYWRGLNTTAKQSGWKLPGIIEILKTGARF